MLPGEYIWYTNELYVWSAQSTVLCIRCHHNYYYYVINYYYHGATRAIWKSKDSITYLKSKNLLSFGFARQYDYPALELDLVACEMHLYTVALLGILRLAPEHSLLCMRKLDCANNSYICFKISDKIEASDETRQPHCFRKQPLALLIS